MPFKSLRELNTAAATEAVSNTMKDICGNRRYLLKVVCGGRYHWGLIAGRAFKGMPVDDSIIDAMWHYFVQQAGGGDLKAELGQLLEEQPQAEQHSELDDIVETVH